MARKSNKQAPQPAENYVCATCGKPWENGACSGRFINHTEAKLAPAPRTPMQYQVPALTREVLADAQTPEQTSAEEPGGVSTPIMVTQQMEADLRARGYSQADIDKMTPEKAHELLVGIPEGVVIPDDSEVEDEDELTDPLGNPVVIPDEATAAAINLGITHGGETKPLHVKLKEIAQRPEVIANYSFLKNDVWRVRRGHAATWVLVPGHGAMPWDETPEHEGFCLWNYGVTARQMNRLMEVDDLSEAPAVRVKKTFHFTQAEKDELVNTAIEQGKKEAFAELSLSETEEVEEETEDASNPEVAKMVATLNDSAVPKIGCDPYAHFESVKDDHDVLADEFASMLVEFKIDLADQERLYKKALKKAQHLIREIEAAKVKQ